MPSSLLFGVNNEGRVYTLSTGGSMWRELPYNGQEFKKLSGVPFFLWGLGGDHQLYVYVHGLDIPIRIREESYENERWLPIEGFSSRLLPTDRCHFSNADGTIDRSIDKIRLPSMAWQWEGDWQLELTLDGRPLDHNGWTYAVDFPAQFSAKKQWKSCVRRRLWTRTAKYCAMNSWCAIAPLHKDATKEPYIDVAVGGQNVPGTAPGTILVWAVTSHNRVMFRVGVSTKSPEGARWNQIQVPPGCEINQVSVGPCGLVWAALLDGRALVRLGVTRDTLQGESWLEVRSPGDGLRITQLSVGSASVWAVTNDKQIWFRQGVKGEGAGVSEEMAAGALWIEMVGRMLMVSVTSNDHVFAVGADDRLIYQRIGIGAADFTGKRWRALRAPLQVSRASSNASLGRDKFHRSLTHLGSRPSSMIEQSNLSEYEEQSRSAPLGPTSLPAGEPKFEIEPKHHKAWSPVRSVGSIVGTEAHPETDESVWNESSRGSCIFSEEDELGWAEFDAPWSWVEAGTCLVETAQPPNWFPDANCAALQEEFEQEWRNRILDDLKCRTPALNAFAQYEKAVETASWLHKAEARVNLGGGHFVDCILQLEWIQTAGTLTVLNADGATSMHSFPLSDVTCVQLSSEPGSPRLAVHTPRNSPAVVILQFPSDVLVEEWQTHFYATCGKLRDAKGKVSEESVWAVTNLGDVFVWDSAQLESAQLREDDCYVQKFDLSGKECPIKVALHVGCVPGTTLTLTGCVADDAERLGINLEAAPTYRNKHKTFAELENVCLHLNPRFGDATLVRNSMSDGKWHEEERDGGRMPFGRGREFKLTIDSTEDAFRIVVDDAEPITFRHRLPSQSACFLHLWGRMRPFKLVIRSPAIVVDPLELYWRPLGGHLRRVESCTVGVTWGIGYDHTAWVYTGGWGGGFLGPSDSQNVGPMTDSQDYRVYENQRWNPVSGYTSSGLPTDRHMWSDVTGKQKRLKEQVKLLSCRWQWVSDWMVDFHVPGGVDKEGWQYAVDFPATYHANKQFTDMVRRRRWYRRCAIATTGPWHELGHTKLLDVTLETVNDEPDSPIAVWALANGGQAMFRVGTSRTNPAGHVWEHVTTDQPLTSISCGPYDRVWATGKTGCAYLRAGVTADLLQGERWTCVAPPSGARLKQISSNGAGVWAADASGRLHVRVAVTSSVPEGADWQTIVADPPILNAARPTSGFKQVSVGKSDVWTITDGGAVARRLGISVANPAGSGWDIGIAGNWQHLSVRGFR